MTINSLFLRGRQWQTPWGPNFRTILHWIRIHLTQVQDCLEHIIRRSEVEGWDILGYLGIPESMKMARNDGYSDTFFRTEPWNGGRSECLNAAVCISYIYNYTYIYLSIYIYITYIYDMYMLRCRMLGLREAWLWMTAVLLPFCFSWRRVKRIHTDMYTYYKHTY